ncbi:unnamed protein product [Darwinula stevensoni]|uniref:Uncharacterized protein n=1 Tax=Darwinula stevensoni TaxID=69355 RepID=A0A7R8XG34_9CRUS|nr:unnamed protein product [Darwinula stevensoni]CAG0895914.1 unnamed protein product [Darwinula stevensoni]
MKVVEQYVKNFLDVYQREPKFLFTFQGMLSHDDYNRIGAVDNDFLVFLQWLNDSGHLNNTLLIVMSDHGHRQDLFEYITRDALKYTAVGQKAIFLAKIKKFAEFRATHQGKMEERMPFFSFRFPSWFHQKYPKAMANFRRNVELLSTPFDIHETLLNVIHFKGEDHRNDVEQRALSLFAPIPVERTCGNAFIEPHWCACLHWKPIPNFKVDPMVQRVAQHVINTIDEFNQNSGGQDLCARLQLGDTLWAAVFHSSPKLLEFKKTVDKDGFVAELDSQSATKASYIIYQVSVRASPGEGLFEASITHHIDSDSLHVKMEDIGRINKYGPQARCLSDRLEHLRKFCYCLHD